MKVKQQIRDFNRVVYRVLLGGFMMRGSGQEGGAISRMGPGRMADPPRQGPGWLWMRTARRRLSIAAFDDRKNCVAILMP